MAHNAANCRLHQGEFDLELRVGAHLAEEFLAHDCEIDPLLLSRSNVHRELGDGLISL